MSDLLFLSHRIPYPPNKGDKLRSFHLLKQLRERFRVYLGCFIDDADDWRHVETVKRMCQQTMFVSLSPGWRRIRSLGCLLTGEALSLGYYRDAAMSRWVDDVVRTHAIRRIVVFSSVMAQYVDAGVQGRRIADMVDVDSAKWGQYALEQHWPLSWLYRREARTLLAYETHVANTFDATVFVSKAEAELFKRISAVPKQRIHYASNGVDTEFFKPGLGSANPYPSGRTLVFTGAMDYRPNVDAVRWFGTEVFPLLRATWPDLRFAIVGARPTTAVCELAKLPGILVTGTVPDVRPYIEHALAVVAPLRIARGVQNKVLEGMAMGRTVIASSDAAEGIDAEAGRDLVVARTREDYLTVIGQVVRGDLDVGAAARRCVVARYSWTKNLGRIRSLLDATPEVEDETSEHATATA